MKTLIFTLTLVIASFSFGAKSEKPISWKCQSTYKDPIFYRATLEGPSKTQTYKLKFSYTYLRENLIFQYDVKKINKSFIGQKARAYNLTPQKNKSVRLYIETDKDGPIDMICR